MVTPLTSSKPTESPGIGNWETLPPELWTKIFLCLDPVNLFRCRSVNRTWKIRASDQSLWHFVLKANEIRVEKYVPLSLVFQKMNSYEIALLLLEKYANTYKICDMTSMERAASVFVEIHAEACNKERYDIVLRCQQLAMERSKIAGARLKCAYIESLANRITVVSDQCVLDSLIQQGIVLADENLEYGLTALNSVICGLAKARLFEQAMKLAERTEQKRSKEVGLSARKYPINVLTGKLSLPLPHKDLHEILMQVGQDVLANECAERLRLSEAQDDQLPRNGFQTFGIHYD